MLQKLTLITLARASSNLAQPTQPTFALQPYISSAPAVEWWMHPTTIFEHTTRNFSDTDWRQVGRAALYPLIISVGLLVILGLIYRWRASISALLVQVGKFVAGLWSKVDDWREGLRGWWDKGKDTPGHDRTTPSGRVYYSARNL
jgi:hypothetical protein